MQYVRNLLRGFGQTARREDPVEIGQQTPMIQPRRRVLNEAAHKQAMYSIPTRRDLRE